MDSDSDSDIEIVHNSVDEDAGNQPLSSSSSSSSSLHSLSKRRVLHHQRSSSSKTTITSRTAAASTTTTISSRLPQSSSSDIELISGPPTLSHRDASTKRGAGTDLTNRIGRGSSSTSASSKCASSLSAKIGGFKSASAILKDQAKEARRRSSSAVSSDAATGAPPSKSRDVSPALSSSSSDLKGKTRDDSLPPPLQTQAIEQEPRHLEDEDEDIVELPPPSQIPIINVKEQSPIASLLDEAMPSSSPVAAFRNTLNRFKAPSIPQNTRSSSNRSSMFAGNNGSRATSSSVIAVLSDSSDASISTSLSSLTRSRSTNKASTSSSITDQLQIPTPFLAIITRCPTCDAEWTVTKDPKVKLNHIRKCSITKSYSPHEIDALVEKQVRSLQALAEEKNRKIHEGRTLLEGVLSKKRKDVFVIGVEGRDVANGRSEKKGKGKALNETGRDMDEMDNLEARQVVLSTQGGSTYSQATSTQVQKELNKRIKTAQRIGRGDFLNVPSTANTPLSDHSSHSASEGSGSDAQGKSNNGKSILEEAYSKSRKKKGSANVSGVGSKNWLKAAQLLKVKDKETSSILRTEMDGDTSLLSTAHIGASISSTFTSSIDSTASGKMKGGGAKGRKQRDTSANLANRLVSYEESRYRLAEKVKNIASSRATRRSSDTLSIASDPVDNAVAAIVKIGANEPIRPFEEEEEEEDTSLMRPYRNPSDLEICLLDKAIRRGVEKRKSGYDAWDLAGSVEDSEKNRYVSQSPSPTSPSTPRPAAQCHRVSDSSNDLLDTNMHPLRASHNIDVTTAHPVDPSTSVPTPPSSPPIDKLSLDSPSTTRFPGVPTDTTQSPSGPNHILLPSSRNYLGPSFTSSTATIDDFRSLVTHTPTSTAPNADANGLNTTDSSNGLFESSAALQALTQKLKATSSSSTKPILAQRRAAAAASLAKKSPAVIPGTPSSLLPNAMASMQLYASTSTSTVSTLSMRTYATKTEGLGGREDLLEEIAEKPKTARPKKTSLDSDESVTVANMSPKRRKRQDESSATSDAEEAVSKPVKQDTLTFKATKTKKTTTTKATATSPKARKKASTDVSSPRKKKATSTSMTEALVNDYATTHPGMPDYDNWSKEELQAETGKYGYKPAGTKKVLVSQLVKVWEAIHPEQFPVEEKVEPVPPWRRSASPESAKKGKGKAKAKAKAAVLESDIDSDSSGVSTTPGKKKVASTKKKKKAVTAASPKKKKATTAKGKAIAAAMAKRKAASSGSDPDGEESDIHANDEVGEEEIDTDESPEVLKSAGERMREAILKDEKFYLRILRYEPIQFDDFEMILDAEKIKMSKIALRDWLDTQGITFYYDQNNGRNAARRGRKKRAAAK